MKTVAVVIARMGSTRLPGKVLMDLAGRPVLQWAVSAAAAASGVDDVIVATSTLPGDDRIYDWCKDYTVACVRGSESDVLSRVKLAATVGNADAIIRITADCPFIDPMVLGEVIRLQHMKGCHYASNIDPRTWPDGLDVECFTIDALTAADAEATRPIDRECVTTWIQRNRSRFSAEAVVCPLPNMHKERWVLDTQADYDFCRAVAKQLPLHQPISYLDILDILDREPELRDLNRHHVMNERFYDALAQEPIYPRSYARSQQALARAEKTIPLAAQTFSKSKVQFPQPSPLFLSHGQGGLAWDVDGNEYVDLVSALLPNILGYRDPDVDVAIRRQLASGISFSLATELEADLAERLCRLIPCAEMVRLGKSGTDVTTAAIRLARAYTGRDYVVICSGGYHGWSDWSVERNLGVPKAVQNLTLRMPYGRTDLLPAHDKIAAIIIEPEGDPKYLRFLREYCDGHGILLIFDEVITGFRFALGGAQALHGVTPDLATFGKAMGNGMPISALVGHADIMERMAPGDEPNIFYSGTMFGETLSIAAAIATVDKLEREDVIPQLWAMGTILADRVDTMLANHDLTEVISTYGRGPLVRLKFRDDKIAALFRKEMIASGTLIIASHNLCYAHTANDITRVRNSYDHALGVIADALRRNDIDKRLAGASVQPLVRAS